MRLTVGLAVRRILLVALWLCALAATTSFAEEASPSPEQQSPAVQSDQSPGKPPEFSPEQLQFFENKIRPILVNRCQSCHGEEKQSGGLRLDGYAAVLVGGDSGSALTPGEPADSLLIEAINYQSLEMPPKGKLPAEEIELLTRWVAEGAAWTPSETSGAVPVREAKQITAADRQQWAFQKPVRPTVPQVKDEAWIQSPIDSFILSKLEAAGLKPAPAADKTALIRRATFDLIGLPPTPEEIENFLQDDSPEAFANLVDRLLARPEYGERWGRHWLDLVRYAQTNGYERDGDKPEAWRYRDYVIKAFNEDKPYDQFVMEQLAGDELQPITDDGLTATAFYRLGVWDDEPDDTRQAIFDGFDDMVATTGSTFLGLTIGCARCHDHKFDPLLQEDYYSLLAFMRNVTYYGNPKPDNSGGTNASAGILRKLSDGSETLAVSEAGPDSPPTSILIRGDAGTPGKEVQPQFVQVLCTDSEASTLEPGSFEKREKSSGRRLVLAKWIASAENPLTARVIVNRLWQHHFGRGIVATPSDFGATGEDPTHPELLDWLATDLIEGGWKLKRMHRQMMLSSVYQQSSRGNLAAASAVDADNQLLWHYPIKRLEAEAIRDAILAVSGELIQKIGGPGIYPELPQEVLNTQSQPGRGWKTSPPEQQGRRSVYVFVKRTLGVPLLDSFDFAPPDQPIAKRTTTTIAPQALILLNSKFIDQQAEAFARRLVKEAPAGEKQQIQRAFLLALGREPSTKELQIASKHLASQRTHWKALLAAAKSDPTSRETNADKQQTFLRDWTHIGGRWSLREDGGLEVQSEPGAKTIWNEPKVKDATITCQIMLKDQQGDAGLIVRVNHAQPGVDALSAYNINLRHDALRLGKHHNNWRELVRVPRAFELDQWHELKIELTGPRIRIYLADEKKPAIDFVDEHPLPSGQIGFRTYRTNCALRELAVKAEKQTWTADFQEAGLMQAKSDLEPAQLKALQSLCKLIFNLNEFVYLD